jgi:DNA-directed RNA polymerase beta subunit
MLSKKMCALLNKQIETEANASSVYLAMASWVEYQGYEGAASFLYGHSDEERMHMLKLLRYVNERGGHGLVPAIKVPAKDFKSLGDIFEDLLKHEIKVSTEINKIVDAALIAKWKKPGYEYSHLDSNGLIGENTPLDDKKVVIGKVTNNLVNPNVFIDASITPKKGQLGFVDKAFITEGEEGFRIAKIRIREERIPAQGDKFCSRCGQKGTIGTLIPEENMPFTKDGIRPDLIINPHCMPSRMTINQLIECLFCKMAVQKGTSVDSTPFVNKGSKHKLVGTLLKEFGCHSSGNEVLYNGMNGEQIESDIYMGPTYYTRLKHMTQDKINYRAGGPRVALTRQTNHGRSKDGGLKIGDMERDSIVSHGMSAFMCDSMMKRGDAYRMAICNHSGTIAIYNKEQNNFYSPINCMFT